MDFTPGEILFYGGIAGMALTAIIAAVTAIILAGSRKRLRNKLNDEYGGNTRK